MTLISIVLTVVNLIQVTDPPEVTGESNQILIWGVSGLITFVGAILGYLVVLNNKNIEYLKNQLALANSKADTELAYSKEQDKATTKIYADTMNIMSNVVNKMDDNANKLNKNSIILEQVKLVQTNIQESIKEIRAHNGDRK